MGDIDRYRGIARRDTTMTKQHSIRRNGGFRVLQRGQGMTEYIIIVALIAIAAIAAFTFFGSTIRSQLGGIALELSGGNGQAGIGQAKDKAGKIMSDAQKSKNMGKYNAENEGK